MVCLDSSTRSARHDISRWRKYSNCNGLMYSSSGDGLYPSGTIGRPPFSVLYCTTFTLPFGAGACGFAATATATLPIGRCGTAGAGFATGASEGPLLTVDVIGAVLVAGFAAGVLTAT